MSEANLCCATYVHGSYQYFIPIYVASILRSYPDAFVKLFVDGELSVGDMTKHIQHNISDRFEIVPNAAPLSVKQWEHKRAARWFIPANEFSGFQYGYIGDVDMLVLREPSGITGPHAEHARYLEVPYSNVVRDRQNRLSGLHFIEVEPYFEKITPALDRYREDVAFCSRNNETVLYQMVKETIGLPIQRMQERRYRPHHGIHLGLFRERSMLAMCRQRYHDSGETRQAQRQFRDDEAFMWLVKQTVDRCHSQYLRHVFLTLLDLLLSWE